MPYGFSLQAEDHVKKCYTNMFYRQPKFSEILHAQNLYNKDFPPEVF